MSSMEPSHDPLRGRVERYCDGTLSDADMAALERRLRDDPQALEFFVLYMEIHSQIAWTVRAHAEEEGGEAREPLGGGNEPEAAFPPAVRRPPLSSFPPIVLDLPLTPPSPLFTFDSSVGGFLFSYTTAAVILGIALLIGWTWTIHYDHQTVIDAPRQVSRGDVPETPLVGRVNGAIDCRWADGAAEAFEHDGVRLGRRYTLLSGFLEIAYDRGAKVILQGPCTYEVESTAGGFLSFGKLTAGGEEGVRGQGSGVR